ncbi:MAG: hypothetical protein J6B43_00330 [Lachnospiraceae bacterium]|nr:hypothetical protein [Lachnospiraceae bacterium]
MRTKRFLAAVGLAVSLVIGSVAAPMAVSAASDCNHASGYDEPTVQVAQWKEDHSVVVDGKTVICTVTYTTYRRVTICRACHEVLATNEYTTYSHSVSH